MAESREDEIYSIMFSSLKHPVRRKILRMLGIKPLTFMEMVEQLGVSSSHLTYHLESLGELVSKMDNGQYKLSTFGLATVDAMKGVEEVHEAEPKKRLSFRWKTVTAGLLVAVLILAALGGYQFSTMNHLSASQKTLAAENMQLMSWGVDGSKVSDFLQNVTQIASNNYTISLLSDTMTYRTDFGGVPEENLQYSFASTNSNLNVQFRFRDNHFSRYELDMIESAPIFTLVQPDTVLQNAKEILARYQAYSGDSYLTNMTSLLATVTTLNNTEVTQGNMKLQITISGGTETFLWMYSVDGIDYQAKGLEMDFQGNVLTTMTDGYFLFTVGSTDLAVSQQQAVTIAENYVKTLTWTIEGQQVSHFTAVEPPLSVQLVPHPRGNSVALIPYWYIEMSLTVTYQGGINEVTVGIYADTGQVSDVQMLSASTT
ncbi:MAG: winged helix-turn-helix domain-containing protein [Candidatus Bathyarchaeia archaeon]|jgi:DNA-binding transcriptional ArsR family regulator